MRKTAIKNIIICLSDYQSICNEFTPDKKKETQNIISELLRELLRISQDHKDFLQKALNDLKLTG